MNCFDKDKKGFFFFLNLGQVSVVRSFSLLMFEVKGESCVYCKCSVVSGTNWPFRLLGWCKLDPCLSRLKRVTEDFCGDTSNFSGCLL